MATKINTFKHRLAALSAVVMVSLSAANPAFASEEKPGEGVTVKPIFPPIAEERFRGEIVVDSDGNCYISSCSGSTDFPTTAGAYQETYGGGDRDIVVFSMPPDLESLNWSRLI